MSICDISWMKRELQGFMPLWVFVSTYLQNTKMGSFWEGCYEKSMPAPSVVWCRESTSLGGTGASGLQNQ